MRWRHELRPAVLIDIDTGIEKPMEPLVRPLITSAIFMGGIFALALVPTLDRRGLPGGLFAVVILLILMLLSVRVVLGEFPPRGRRRMLADAARSRGLRIRIRPRIPRSMKTLPSFADGRTFGPMLGI